MYLEPETSLPMFVINTPVKTHDWEDKLFDVDAMFSDELYTIRAHADVGDDRVPATRVNFGTAQIAAAFGCEMYIPPNNLPCAKTHVLHDINDAVNIKSSLNLAISNINVELITSVIENLPQHHKWGQPEWNNDLSIFHGHGKSGNKIQYH